MSDQTYAPGGFRRGQVVKLSARGRVVLGYRLGQDRHGVVVCTPRRGDVVRIRWEGQTQKNSEYYAQRFVEIVP